MFGLFRRSNIHNPENEEENVPAAKTEEQAGGKLRTIESDDRTYALLITAQDNTEAAFIESVLRSARIPYVIRDNDGESWMRVIMGFNVFGSDFFVPEELLDDAAALLVPDGEAAVPGDGADDGNGTGDGDGNADGTKDQ